MGRSVSQIYSRDGGGDDSSNTFGVGVVKRSDDTKCSGRHVTEIIQRYIRRQQSVLVQTTLLERFALQ